MKNRNRVISLFLSLLLIVGLFPLEAFASGDISGEGTVEIVF